MSVTKFLQKRIKTLKKQLTEAERSLQNKHKHRFKKIEIPLYVDSGETFDGYYTYFQCSCGKNKETK